MTPYLRVIEFRNFKNFRLTDFGPFQPRTFYSIIGGNGVGKSNFVDGLAFVFGERNWDILRVTSAKKLLCRQTLPGQKDCSVAAVFCIEGEQLKRFERSIDSEGSDVFIIDNEVVDFDEYQRELLTLKIDMTLPNVIVPQGSIVSMATKTPEQLSHFFEEVSGSSVLHKEYDTLKKEIAMRSYQISITKEEIKFSSKCLSLSGGNHLPTDAVKAKTEWALFRVYHHGVIEKFLEDKIYQQQMKLAESKSVLTLKQSELKEKEKNLEELSQLECDLENQIQERDVSLKRATGGIQAVVELLEGELRLGTDSIKELNANLEKSKEAKRVLETKFHKTEEALQGISDSTCSCFNDFDQNEEYGRVRKKVASQTSEITVELLTLDLKQNNDSKYLNELELSLRNLHGLINRKKANRSTVLAKQRKFMGLIDIREDEMEEVKRRMKELESDISKVEKKLKSTINELEDAKRLYDDSHERCIRKSNLSWLQEVFGEEEVICRLKFDSLRNNDDDFGETNDLNKTVMDCLAKYENYILVNSKDTAEKCSELLEMDNLLCETFISITDCMLEINKLREREPPVGIFMSDYLPIPEGLLQAQEVLRFLTKGVLVVENEEDRKAAQDMDFEVVCVSDVKSQDIKKPQVKKADIASLEVCKRRLTKDLAFLKRNLKELADKSETTSRPNRALQKVTRDMVEERDALADEIRTIQEEIDRCEAEIRQLKEKIRADRMRELDRQPSRRNEAVFRDFCATVGVANIEEYEQLCKACRDKGRRLELECDVTTIKNEMSQTDKEIEETRVKVTDMEGKVAETQREFARARREMDDLLASQAETQQNIEKLRIQFLKASDKRIETTKAIEELNKKIHRIQNQSDDLKKILKKCKWQLDDAKELTKEALSHVSIERQADGSSSEESSSESAQEIDPRSINFDEIERYKNMTDAVAISKTDRKLRDWMKRWENDDPGCLREMASRVQDEGAQAAAANAKQRLKRLNKKLRVLMKKFRIAKKDRTDSFNRCFNLVAQALKNVYKAVMDSDGAECNLIPINSDEPYLDGVAMLCWAPDKRHAMQRECLSGGEKSTLAFALILSFDKYHRPPLCVLDEVDSYTDPSKTGNFASVFISKADRSQVFAISHREDVQKNADVLIAICMDRSVLYLNQREYDDEDGQPQQEN